MLGRMPWVRQTTRDTYNFIKESHGTINMPHSAQMKQMKYRLDAKVGQYWCQHFVVVGHRVSIDGIFPN